MKHVVSTIARAQNTRIDRCSCGAVHITVGGTTLRIKDGAARELRDLLNVAMRAIDGHESSVGAPAPSIHLVPSLGNEDDGEPELH